MKPLSCKSRDCLLLVLLLVLGVSLHASPREHLSLDRGWKFHLGDDWPDALHLDKAGSSDGSAAAAFDDHAWRTVQLPHDWAIELPFDPAADRNHGYKPLGPRYPQTSVAWYRRSFALPASDEGRRIWLTFDGVYRDATVWVNGWLVKHHESGYSPFHEDITAAVNPGGANTIAVRVDATKFEGWFCEGAGIYRHVWRDKTEPLALASDGLFVHADIPGNVPQGPAPLHLRGSALAASGAAPTRTYEAEAAERVGAAAAVADPDASGGAAVKLSGNGQAIRFTHLPAAGTLAIRYASKSVGALGVTINHRAVRPVNVHSSGALTGSFLEAIVPLAIPAGATLVISPSTPGLAVSVDRIAVGDGDLGLPPDIWNLPPLPVAPGPYGPDWQAISRRYTVPEWWRDAKFGAWSHWDPQSMPEQGDWYARGMYLEGSRQYNYHVAHFGHPSVYGYKDLCHNWVIDRWDPEALMTLYAEMGARYFMAMGVHHDNFDNWDSRFQPWNSVRVGPKVDIVGMWAKVAREHGLRFGIGFHNTPARTWGQFMPVRYTSDQQGPMKGVPYDALQTIRDGKGKWWEGLDPVDLYGPPHRSEDPLHSPFANQFMWRVDDALTKYHPDIIYFDEHAGDSQIDLGVHMGLGFLGPVLAANFYNKSLQWHGGEMEVVLNLKGVGGRYNSFQNAPDLVPVVERSLVKSSEMVIEPEISAYSFQTETTIAPWHYEAGQEYPGARQVVALLLDNVCRNGTMLLNLTQHGRGDLDPALIRIARDIGAWLKLNGEAVYGSRPFEVCGEEANTVCYTRNEGRVYAAILNWPGGPVVLPALRTGGATLGHVSQVELLGSNVACAYVQDEHGLTVTPAGPVPPLPGIADQALASNCRVLRITHDKGWFNDDDPGARYPGWIRRCNLGTGDFNNDLTISATPGAEWSCSFSGTGVAVVAPREPGAGSIEVSVDGHPGGLIDLSTGGARQAQQVVFETTGLSRGQHAIAIVHRRGGPVAIDALVVR